MLDKDKPIQGRSEGQRYSIGRISAGLAIIALTASLILCLFLVPDSDTAGKAVYGRIDLSGSGGTIVSLAGEWEAISPSSARYVSLPIQWEKPFGRAAYRLKISGLDPKLSYALKLPAIDTSFVLLANGERIASAGRLGDSALEARPAYKPGVAKLPRGIGEVELSLEISNFISDRGGIVRAILLGEESAVERASLMGYLSTGLASGLLIMMGCLFLFNAAVKRSTRSLSMGLAYIVGGIGIFLISPEVLAWRFFPNLDWNLTLRFAYAFSLLFPYHIFLAARSYFGGIGKPLFAALSVPIALMELAFIFLPAMTLSLGFMFYEAYGIFLLVIALALCVRAIRKSYPYAWIVTLGFATLALETMSILFLVNFKADASPFLPLSFVYAFANLSGNAATLLDIASIALSMLAFNAFGFILFADSLRAKSAPSEAKSHISAIEARCAELGISPRETEVLLLALGGKRNNEIAEALELTGNTVKTHLSHIYAKTGIQARSELFAFFNDQTRHDEGRRKGPLIVGR